MGYARTLMAGAAAVLVAAGLRLAGPAAAGFVAEEIPRAQAAAATWLTPPYLYLVINAIIISIAASSRYQPTRAPKSQAHAAVGVEEAAPVSAPASLAMTMPMPMEGPAPTVAMAMEVSAPAVPVEDARVPEAVAVQQPAVEMAPAPEVQDEEDFLISRSAWTPQRRVVREEVEVAPFADLTNSREKPLSSARRFLRKTPKPSPEGTA
jgi:hypothetical protein